MSEESAQTTVICWECDASTADPVAVVLRVRDDSVIRLKVCPSCYRAYWMLLAADPEARSITVPGEGPAREIE